MSTTVVSPDQNNPVPLLLAAPPVTKATPKPPKPPAQTNYEKVSDTTMLVDLTISKWGAKTKDRGANAELAAAHQSNVQMTAVEKRLLTKEAMSNIKSLTTAARKEYYMRTLPWFDGGIRILSNTGYAAFTAKFRELKAQWDEAVNELVDKYENELMVDAEIRLGSMFRRTEYLTVEQLRERFDLSFRVFPMPEAKDFRGKGLDAVELTRIRQEFEAQRLEQLKMAEAEIFGRIKEVVEKMVEKLHNYKVGENGKVENTFRDSLVENIRSLTGVLPSLNITGNPAIMQFTKDMQGQLLKYSGEQLRDDAVARQTTAEAAEAILKQMESFI